jgi:monomeric isocitrate dehydrogenase
MNGGGLFETVLVDLLQNTLNNSLLKVIYVGILLEFLALTVSLEHLGSVYNNQKHWFYQKP